MTVCLLGGLANTAREARTCSHHPPSSLSLLRGLNSLFGKANLEHWDPLPLLPECSTRITHVDHCAQCYLTTSLCTLGKYSRNQVTSPVPESVLPLMVLLGLER